jgi:hypothetical protein
VQLGIMSGKEFREIERFRRDVEILRDNNEHVIEYFKGGGQKKRIGYTRLLTVPPMEAQP